MNNLGLEDRDFVLVSDILREHAHRRTVWAFGSRATGRRLKQYSDLDLAVEGRLDLHESAALNDAFEESLLPIKVDVVALDSVTPEFRARIQKDFVLVQEAAAVGESASVVTQDNVPA